MKSCLQSSIDESPHWRRHKWRMLRFRHSTEDSQGNSHCATPVLGILKRRHMQNVRLLTHIAPAGENNTSLSLFFKRPWPNARSQDTSPCCPPWVTVDPVLQQTSRLFGRGGADSHLRRLLVYKGLLRRKSVFKLVWIGPFFTHAKEITTSAIMCFL